MGGGSNIIQNLADGTSRPFYTPAVFMTAVAVPPQVPPRFRHMAQAAGNIRSITPKQRVDAATTGASLAVRCC